MNKHERNEIAVLKNKKYSLRDIGIVLKRSASTIFYEIQNNKVREKYDSEKAQLKAYVTRHNASFRGKSIIASIELRSFVDRHLLDGQSPEAISGRIKHHEKHLPYVSKDTIYRYLRSPYGKNIGLKLKKKKRPRRGAKIKPLADRVFIDKRPKIIEKRGRVGDAEGDFIVSCKSGKGILLTATCRKLRAVFLEKISDVSIDDVHCAFLKIQKRFAEMRSITLDNDILFKMHKTLSKLLGIKIYFCHPYHSWEKGGIENANGFIRRYIPKGSDLSRYSKKEIAKIEKRCNSRFMKCLKFYTPNELLFRYRVKQKNSKDAV
ncbi:MAG: IS30 family transposase [Parcubacteria group bacterium]